jgi:hypothetical protein
MMHQLLTTDFGYGGYLIPNSKVWKDESKSKGISGNSVG